MVTKYLSFGSSALLAMVTMEARYNVSLIRGNVPSALAVYSFQDQKSS